MKRLLSYPSIAILAVVLLVLGGAIATWETKSFADREYTVFSEKSIRLASVFANSASVWLVRGNDEAIAFAAGILLAGSGQYVRIVLETGVVFDQRIHDSQIEELVLSSDWESMRSLEAQSSLRSSGLDVSVPITVSSQPSHPIAVVQVGFSGEYTAREVRSHRILIFGLMLGSWLLVLVLAIAAVRVLGAKSGTGGVQEQEEETVIRCGGLEIDAESCTATYCGQAIDLAPKMYELLLFLARNPGKTFSDRDLVAALWADAPYAASGDVKQCIYMLRKRLKVACADPKRIIVNVPGFGYKLECPDEDELSDS